MRTQFITLTPPAVVNRGTPPPSAIERPVGTTGFLRAAAEMPVARPAAVTEAEMLPSPVQMLEFTESRAVMTADVPPRLETPEPDAPPAGRAKTSSPEVEAIPVIADRSPERKKGVDLKKADLTNPENEQEEIVRRVLFDYKQAYDQLDVNSLKAIWPSLDDRKLRELQRAFRGLEGQELRFAKCGVSVTGRDANARCQGDATYRPKVGSRVHLQEAQWTFSLARANDRWQIVNASLQ